MKINDRNIKLTSLSSGGGCGCKIPPNILKKITNSFVNLPLPKEFLVGINSSDDAAVYKIDDEKALVFTTDFFMPIVDDPFDFGKIAATNAISDIYAMGGNPLMALAIVAMPVNKLSTEIINKILEGGKVICEEAGISIVGGHSIKALEPIYGLAVLGIVHPSKIKKNNNAKIGDKLILSKPLGIGILTSALKKNKLNVSDYNNLINSTTKLNKPGKDLANIKEVNSLTDVTGFGLLGHSREIAFGSKKRIRLFLNEIPFLPNTKNYAAKGFGTAAAISNWETYKFDIELNKELTEVEKNLICDPQTSGGLLVSCNSSVTKKVLTIFQNHGFKDSKVIGEIIEGKSKIEIVL